MLCLAILLFILLKVVGLFTLINRHVDDQVMLLLLVDLVCVLVPVV
jgi:hypothetical protein